VTTDDFDARDQLARLQLIRSANIGPVTYVQLIARFGSAQAALQAIPDLAARGGGRPPRLASLGDIEREVDRVRTLGARYLFLGQRDYPALLAEMDSAPPALIYRGRLELAQRPMIALVGARNASAAACRFARGLAQDLGRIGVSIVSGLARGIDTAAHEGSLASGTIAVIASGIDIAFPPENAALQDRIAQEGLLLAEQPPGTQPLARHFPSRNRIIAWNGGGGGRATLGLADHRAAGGGSGQGGYGRARLSARSARTRLQRPDPRGRDADPECRGRDGGHRSHRRPAGPAGSVLLRVRTGPQ
jgi:predicted Rossmann fold nucleotide-binding protein DprA/Smf involved in DNA uptake